MMSMICCAEKPGVDEEIINTVKLLEIANGDAEGNMNFDKSVTRAEFLKMTISASSYKDDAVNTKLNVSLFPDVRNSFWGAGYISVAIKNGLVAGYLDGTFKPHNPVTLEEAVTIVLRLLGYTNSDLTGSYPTAQLAKYESLKLDENLNAKRGDKLTREECMVLIYNALSAKTKQGAVYCTTLGYSTNSEGKIDYSALLEQKLDGPTVVESIEELKESIPFAVTDDTAIQLNNAQEVFSSLTKDDVVYYSEKLNKVFAYRKTATGIVNSSNQSTVTISGKTYTLATSSSKSKLSLGGKYNGEKSFVTLLLGINDTVADIIDGDVSRIDDNSDNSTYISMIDSTISAPIYIKVKGDIEGLTSKIPFDTGNCTVTIDGKSGSLDNVQTGDVVYYSEPFKSIWVYRDSVSGIIGSVSSSSINVGGKTYLLATNDAKYKVSAYGAYGTNDYVTLILGKDNEVIDITDADVTGIGEKDNDSSYSEVVSSTLKGPYVVSADGKMDNLKIEADSATIYLLGKEITPDSINPYDVYYFSELLDTIWIYRDTASGTIEAITPVSSPTSVVVSGRTYPVKDSKVSYALSNFGSYNIGDKATLLLGMDGDVAGIVSPEEVSAISYGVVTGLGEKTYTDKNGSNYTAECVTVTTTANVQYTYEHDNGKLAIGDAVKVSVAGSVKITKLYTQIKRADAAMLSKAFNNGLFTERCEIIDYRGKDVIKVYPSRMSGLSLDTSFFLDTTTVQYYSFDSNGYIEKLILKDFTGDIDEYGIVLSSQSGVITYLADATEKTVSSEGHCSEGPAKLLVKDGRITFANQLTAKISDVEGLTMTTLYDGNDKAYPLADDVKVFIRYTSYTYAELEDVINEDYNFTAYYDKPVEYGGRIRVIIASKLSIS